ncbi:uncharacterized protein LOC144433014 [Glandiceps talaboti]
MPNAGTAAFAAAFEAKKNSVQMPVQQPLTVMSHTPRSIPLPQAVTSVPHDEVARFSHSKRVGQYLLGRTLGEGSFAKVKEGIHIGTGEKVAVKIIDKEKAKEDHYVRKNLRREGKILQMVRHAHIVKLLETLETDNHYYLVMEFCSGGNILGKVSSNGNIMAKVSGRAVMSEAEVRKYLRQVVSAVDHLHRAGIVHRDLKVENLLLDDDGNIKIIDFGLSNSLRSLSISESTDDTIPIKSSQEMFQTQCGSPAYAAPELLAKRKYSTNVDVWSIGVNMFVMLTGVLPFTVDPYNLKALYKKMINKDTNPVPPYLSEDCRDLLFLLLEPDPRKRPQLTSIMDHQWLNKGCLPLQLVPFPNYLKQDDVNQDIIHHMCQMRGYKMGDLIKVLVNNKAIESSAVYHLLVQRLNRFNKDKLKKKRFNRLANVNVGGSSTESTPREKTVGTFTTRGGTREVSEWVPMKFHTLHSDYTPRQDGAKVTVTRKVKVTLVDKTMPLHLTKPRDQLGQAKEVEDKNKEEVATETQVVEVHRFDSANRDGYLARENTPEEDVSSAETQETQGSNKENSGKVVLKSALKKSEQKTPASKKQVTIVDDKPSETENAKSEKNKNARVTTITYPLSFRQMYEMNKERGSDIKTLRKADNKKYVTSPRKKKDVTPRTSKLEPQNSKTKPVLISVNNSTSVTASTKGSYLGSMAGSLISSKATGNSLEVPNTTDESSPISLFYDPSTYRVQAKCEGRPVTKEIKRWQPPTPLESQTPAIPTIVPKKKKVKIRTPTPEEKEPLHLPQLALPLLEKSGFEPTYTITDTLNIKTK